MWSSGIQCCPLMWKITFMIILILPKSMTAKQPKVTSLSSTEQERDLHHQTTTGRYFLDRNTSKSHEIHKHSRARNASDSQSLVEKSNFIKYLYRKSPDEIQIKEAGMFLSQKHYTTGARNANVTSPVTNPMTDVLKTANQLSRDALVAESTKGQLTTYNTEQETVTHRLIYSTPDRPIHPINCTMDISNKSVHYFANMIKYFSPNVMHFEFIIHHDYNVTPDSFRPTHWVWTYSSPKGLYPYLHWNIDFGILSFGLLDAKTLPSEPFILLNLPKECPVTFGSPNTTAAIAKVLLYLTKSLSTFGPKYDNSYYCYLAEAPNVRDTVLYQVSLYLLYPINYINYNCCRTYFNYTEDEYRIECLQQQMKKWVQCAQGPYILGIIIFFYFPIILFQIAGWISKGEHIYPNEYEMVPSCSIEDGPHTSNENPVTASDNEWSYLDGTPPCNFLDLFSVFWCGLDNSHPVLVSRVRRFVCVLLMPSIIFIQILVYYIHMDPETLKQLIKKGTPIGFLSLLGDRSDRNKGFAPMFGGPICVFIIYYLLGVTFVVVPTSLKQIIENGLPTKSLASVKSPLCLGADSIIELSQVPVKREPGYKNAANLCKCSIYMIFTKLFWAKVYEIQKERMFNPKSPSNGCMYVLKLISMPVYISFCGLEILMCIIVYSLPFLTFVTIMVKGATRALIQVREQQRNKRVNSVLDNPITICIGTVLVFAMFLFFAYAVCLIFVQSFSFLSQIVVFCFVAVIVYPAVAFGYLFFFVVLLYYIVRLIRDFGFVYLDLLSEAVEISKHMEEQPSCVSSFEGILVISNVKEFPIKQICINNQFIHVPQNALHSVFNDKPVLEMLKKKDNLYGIPTKLFNVLIQKHRPIHQQVLKIAFQLILISLLLLVTMSITAGFVTGPTSEISDVMHVIFIVTIGALPRVLEVALMNVSESLKKEIELRHIEQTIMNFWREEIRIIRIPQS